MDGHAEEMTVWGEKLCKLPSGKWYLRCERCQQEVRAEAYLTEDKWEMEELRAEVIELKAEVEKWEELVKKHVAYKAAHVAEIRKLKQGIAQLKAEVTAVPDDIP